MTPRSGVICAFNPRMKWISRLARRHYDVGSFLAMRGWIMAGMRRNAREGADERSGRRQRDD